MFEVVVIHFNLSITEKLRSDVLHFHALCFAAVRTLYSLCRLVSTGCSSEEHPLSKVLESLFSPSFSNKFWLKLAENQENCLLHLGP